MTSAPAIGFECRPSCWSPRLLWLLAGLEWLALALTGMPIGLKWLLAVLVAVLL